MQTGSIKVGMTLSNRYEITKNLGEGGFAVVFQARDLQLNRIVAIKALKYSFKEEELSRFRREAMLLGQLVHPNIVSVYAFDFFNNDTAIIVMEFLDGLSLNKHLQKNVVLNAELSQRIFSQVCAGLSYAHEAGVVHRDLNPQNIFLVQTDNGIQAKLIDFGLSRLIAPDAEVSKLTQTGLLLGTPPFMSPELCKGEKATPASDIYSLGCIIYFSVTGNLPLESDSLIGFIFAHQNDFPTEPKILWNDIREAERFKSIILRCLQKDPAKRFPTCASLQAKINDGGELEAEHSKSEHGNLQAWTLSSTTSKSKHRWVKPLLIAVTAVLSLFISAILLESTLIDLLSAGFCNCPYAMVLGPEQSFATCLLAKKKYSQSFRIFQNIISKSSIEKDTLAYRNSTLGAAEAKVADTQIDNSGNSIYDLLDASLKANLKLERRDFQYLKKVLDVLENMKQKSLKEVYIRARLLSQLRDASKNHSLINKEFNSLLDLNYKIRGKNPAPDPNLPADFVDNISSLLQDRRTIVDNPTIFFFLQTLPVDKKTKELYLLAAHNRGVKPNDCFKILIQSINVSSKSNREKIEAFRKLLKQTRELNLIQAELYLEISNQFEHAGDHESALQNFGLAENLAKTAEETVGRDIDFLLKGTAICNQLKLPNNRLETWSKYLLRAIESGAYARLRSNHPLESKDSTRFKTEKYSVYLMRQYFNLVRGHEEPEIAGLRFCTELANDFGSCPPFEEFAKELSTSLGKTPNLDRAKNEFMQAASLQKNKQ